MNVEFWNLLVVYYAVFFITSVYILYKLTPDIATKSERTAFRILVVMFMVYLIVNLACTLQVNGVIFPPRSVCYIIGFFSLLTVLLNGVALYHFIVTRFLMPLPFKRKYYLLFSAIPLAVMVFCMIVSLFNGMVFSLDENNFVIYGSVYPIFPYIIIIYYVGIIAVLIYKFIKSSSYVCRQQVITSLGAVCFLIVSIIVNSLFYAVTTLPPAVFVSILVLYMNMQEATVYTDALTGMNNRRKANEFLSGLINGVSSEKNMYLYMCDVNDFKKINDYYGHDEGDKALIMISNVLKEAIGSCDGFAARFGGDEFILSCIPRDSESDPPTKLIDTINNSLASACKRNKMPYSVTLSIGYTLCEDSSKSLQDYIREADEKLYICKRNYHEQGGAEVSGY